MVERKRSTDGRKEAQQLVAEAELGHQGRGGGRLPRQIGSRDEMKRAFERPAGVTRVRKSDEQDDDGSVEGR